MTKEEYFEIEKKLLPVSVEWNFEGIDTSEDWNCYKGSTRLIYDNRISTVPFSFSLGLAYIESWGYLSYEGKYILPKNSYGGLSVYVDKKKEVYLRVGTTTNFIELREVRAKDKLLVFKRNHKTDNPIRPTCAKVKSPSVRDVLECLILEARSGMETFENFCGEFGYDEDSRKAYRIWEACKDNYIMLSKFLSQVGITLNQLEEYLQAKDERSFYDNNDDNRTTGTTYSGVGVE